MLHFFKDKDRKEEPAAEPPIYSSIRSALQADGTLPPDFCLRKKAEDNKITFADGAMDGIGIYHMGFGKQDLQPLYDVVKRIASGSFSEAEEKLQAYFSADEYAAMLPLIDGLQEWIIHNRNDIDPNNLYRFALKTLKESPYIECVKFALSILEMLDSGENKETRAIVETLAASDEFTLFCLFIMRRWPDGNQAIFGAAKKVHGWGRVHAVEQLSTETDEIKHWLLYEGCDNYVTAEYSALTCANKADLNGLLRNSTITAEDFAAAAALIDLLLSEGPVAGISEVEKPDELLTDFLKHAGKSMLSISEYETVLNIQKYYAQKDWPRKDAITETCRQLLASDACIKAVDEAISQGKGFRFAHRLGLDYSRQTYEQIISDFEGSYQLIDLLLPDGLFADEIIALFEQRLPLAKMATGPADQLGMGSEYTKYLILSYILQHLKEFSGKGESLLICALNVPVINCRNMALNVLEAWRDKKTTFSPEINRALERLKRKEVIKTSRSDWKVSDDLTYGGHRSCFRFLRKISLSH
jgi:hypothetical protein